MGMFEGPHAAATSRLDAMGLGGGEGEGKKMLGEVRYRAAEDPSTACGGCANFQPPNACAVVAGSIDQAATCDLFTPAGGGAGPTPEATAVAPMSK